MPSCSTPLKVFLADDASAIRQRVAVHSACPQIALMVFTNNTAAAYRRRYLADGAKCFLDKSADFHQLAQAFKAACAHPVH